MLTIPIEPSHLARRMQRPADFASRRGLIDAIDNYSQPCPSRAFFGFSGPVFKNSSHIGGRANPLTVSSRSWTPAHLRQTQEWRFEFLESSRLVHGTGQLLRTVARRLRSAACCRKRKFHTSIIRPKLLCAMRCAATNHSHLRTSITFSTDLGAQAAMYLFYHCHST